MYTLIRYPSHARMAQAQPCLYNLSSLTSNYPVAKILSACAHKGNYVAQSEIRVMKNLMHGREDLS